MAAWAEDEGTLGTKIIWWSFAKLFNILRFPTHTLLWEIIAKFGGTINFWDFLSIVFFKVTLLKG